MEAREAIERILNVADALRREGMMQFRVTGRPIELK